MSKETGGQAFPRQQWEYDGHNNVLQYQEYGMTLRDYFAAKAMSALMNSIQISSGNEYSGWTKNDFAKEAYEQADAMLKARNS
ncbi:hypothetical protein [Serratia rubidaea]|uniref:hypothetical protein n=1 Tax=Serratia rubidaea TaxID=61652 RepID=UPI003FA36CC7